MRDGVKLYAAIYRPLEGERYPVLLLRSLFSTQHPLYIEWDLRFAKCGYAVVMQDSCGRIESEGKWRPYIDEEAPIRIFVMGQNAWRSEDEWPKARTRYTRFHLHSDGRANSLNGMDG